jgi:hypothetical protein
VLNALEHNKKGEIKVKPNWESEIKYIKDGGGELIPVTVTCDIFINSVETNLKYAFELKGPLPNSDQTKVSKEKMFKLLAMTPKQVDFAYYALPYNPYGEKKDYKWSFPLRWFNMQKDASVLIGDEFWELIGGKGAYHNFINEVNLLGKEYRERIYREFLQIEPPDDSEDGLLK